MPGMLFLPDMAIAPELAATMASVLHLHANPLGSDWVCGDIHGEFSLLETALGDAGFESRCDRLFCTGDLIDRGPESERALEFLEQPWFYSVRGNHDDFLLHHEDREIRSLWRSNGGEWWDRAPPALRERMVAAFRQLPLAITVETLPGPTGILHADVPAGEIWDRFVEKLESDDPAAVEWALWGRVRWMRRDRSGVPGLYRLYCGHTVVGPECAELGNVTFVDTGASYFGTLTLFPFSGSSQACPPYGGT